MSAHFLEQPLPSIYINRCLSVPQDTAELFFEDVRLPASALLGQANKGFYYLMNELPQVHLSEINYTCMIYQGWGQLHFNSGSKLKLN